MGRSIQIDLDHITTLQIYKPMKAPIPKPTHLDTADPLITLAEIVG